MIARDELAARFAVALVGAGRSIGAVEEAFRQADTFLSALAPKPDESAPYVPKVGDRVRFPRWDGRVETDECVGTVKRIDGNVAAIAVDGDTGLWHREIRPRAAASVGDDWVELVAPAPAPTVAPLTEEERRDLIGVLWDRVRGYATYNDATVAADTAAEWFQKRGAK